MAHGDNIPPRNYPEAYGWLIGSVSTAIRWLDNGYKTPGEVAAMLRECVERAEGIKEGMKE